MRFIHGHNAGRGPDHHRWKGGIVNPPYGAVPSLCECGCGAETSWHRGKFRRFRPGHQFRIAENQRPARRTVAKSGYARIGSQYEHILVAERVLGKPLPPGAVVHHVNGRRDDNRPANLVVCPDDMYHRLLHERQRAREACGNPYHRMCRFCKEWDAPENMAHSAASYSHFHRECRNRYRRERRAEGLSS